MSQTSFWVNLVFCMEASLIFCLQVDRISRRFLVSIFGGMAHHLLQQYHERLLVFKSFYLIVGRPAQGAAQNVRFFFVLEDVNDKGLDIAHSRFLLVSVTYFCWFFISHATRPRSMKALPCM